VSTKPRWNPNLHAQELLLRAHVPAGAATGLDVGCGEGETARRLRQHVPSVVGADRHEPSIDEARTYGDDITYVLADLDSLDGSYHVVSAVAMLHHVDQRDGLRKLSSLVAPGGVLLVVSHAKSKSLRDYARDGRDAIGVRRYKYTRGVWGTSAPVVWPPPLTYRQTRDQSLEVLPDATYSRAPYFRYALVWHRPPSSS
jgi:ubiquinone/menaquinone biosynthesis C-methylase UbiE